MSDTPIYEGQFNAAMQSIRDMLASVRDTLTQRQADSIIGASGLPGAKVIPRAQSAADAEAAHNAAIDSASR